MLTFIISLFPLQTISVYYSLQDIKLCVPHLALCAPSTLATLQH